MPERRGDVVEEVVDAVEFGADGSLGRERAKAVRLLACREAEERTLVLAEGGEEAGHDRERRGMHGPAARRARRVAGTEPAHRANAPDGVLVRPAHLRRHRGLIDRQRGRQQGGRVGEGMVEHHLLKSLRHLLPLAPASGAPVVGIGLEALVQDQHHSERSVARPGRGLRQRLQLEHVEAMLLAGDLEELAHLVDHQEQAVEPRGGPQRVAQRDDRSERTVEPPDSAGPGWIDQVLVGQHLLDSRRERRGQAVLGPSDEQRVHARYVSEPVGKPAHRHVGLADPWIQSLHERQRERGFADAEVPDDAPSATGRIRPHAGEDLGRATLQPGRQNERTASRRIRRVAFERHRTVEHARPAEQVADVRGLGHV